MCCLLLVILDSALLPLSATGGGRKATPTNPKIGFIGIEFAYLLNYLKHSVNSECYFIFYSFSAISATRLAWAFTFADAGPPNTVRSFVQRSSEIAL